jgi:hypothetical protein
MKSKDHVACLPSYWNQGPSEAGAIPAAEEAPHTRGMRGTAFDGDWFQYPEGRVGSGDEFFVEHEGVHAVNEL